MKKIMSDQTNKKFIHLSNRPALKLQTLKQQAILSIKQAEKAVNNLSEKIKIAEDFLKTHSHLSPKVQQKLENSVRESKNNLNVYESELAKIKQRMILVLKKSGDL